MSSLYIWVTVVPVLLLAALVGAWWALRPGREAAEPDLPPSWPLLPRPVLNAEERRVFRILQDAYPHHTLMAKLPLVRFCQPEDPAQVRPWYRLIGSASVTFAVCSPSSRVLAAIDLETDHTPSGRSQRIKQEVLSACRVRYLRCTPERLPSAAELQLLVPHSAAGMRGPQPAPGTTRPGAEAQPEVPSLVERRGRKPLWRDPGFMQESYHGRQASSPEALRSILPSMGEDASLQRGSRAEVDLSQDLNEALGDGADVPPMSARH
jgi:hypothetical protein